MPQINETSFDWVGPAILILGDFANGDTKRLGKVRDVQFNPNHRIAFTSADAQSGVPHADGIKHLAAQPSVTCSMQSAIYDELRRLMLGGTTTSSGNAAVLGAPDAYGSVALVDVPTLFVLPVTEEADGVDAEHGIWLPAVTVEFANVNFGRINPGEIDAAYNVTFNGAFREIDQGSTSIPAGNRIYFIGPPSRLGLTWTE